MSSSLVNSRLATTGVYHSSAVYLDQTKTVRTSFPLVGISVPHGWWDGHLVLIKKPGKTGRGPNHHGPIGLQDQLGKLTFKRVLNPYLEDIHQARVCARQKHHRCAQTGIRALSQGERGVPWTGALGSATISRPSASDSSMGSRDDC